MEKYIEILNKLLIDIQFEVINLDLALLDDIDKIVDINQFSNEILSCFIYFLDSYQMNDREKDKTILLQQLKSRLIVNERKVKNMQKLATQLYLDEIEEDEDDEDE